MVSNKRTPWLTDDERQYILSGQQNQDKDKDGEYDEGYNPSTGQLLGHKQSWGVIIASAAIDPIWWLFVVWIPIYLNEVYGMNVKEIGLYGWVPYVGAMIGDKIVFKQGGVWIRQEKWSLHLDV